MVVFKDANEKSVSRFLEIAGDSIKTFRYFNTRDISVIQNHRYTCIMEENGSILGYGHLEEENGKYWLGMALIADAIGKGYGKKLLQQLIKKAQELNLKEIHLTVDNANLAAFNLYTKKGFEQEAKLSEAVLLLRKSLKE